MTQYCIDYQVEDGTLYIDFDELDEGLTFEGFEDTIKDLAIEIVREDTEVSMNPEMVKALYRDYLANFPED